MTRKVNTNESSRNIVKAIWQTKIIGITALNVNVMYHLIFKTLQSAQNVKLVISRQSYRDILTTVVEG